MTNIPWILPIFLLLSLPHSVMATENHSELRSQACPQALASPSFQTQVVRSYEEQWSAISEFIRSHEITDDSRTSARITLIVSALKEPENLIQSQNQEVQSNSNTEFVRLNDGDLESIARNWPEKWPEKWSDKWPAKALGRQLILLGQPHHFVSEMKLTRFIEANEGSVNLVLISKVGQAFPLYIHELENRLMMHATNRTLRIYIKPMNKPLATEAPNSGYKTYIMDDRIQRADGKRFQINVISKRERGDTTTLAWSVFREWIQSTPLTEMRREFDAHRGFIYLLEQLMRAHSAKNKNGFWWQAFSKEDYTKLISAGIISPRFKDLVSVLGQTEAKRLIELSKINKFTQKTKQSNMTNDEGAYHD